jgi:hypothetical protein
MIDLVKYSKKNKFFEFLIINIFKINICKLDQIFFFKKNLDLGFNEIFFYDYIKKNPDTKWSSNLANHHYQSNHDLQKLNDFKKPIIQIENFLNKEVKYKIFDGECFGKFRIKSIWFTIQKNNQGVPKHNHPKSILSGVYYYKVDYNKGGEIEIFNNEKIIEHKPLKNDIIIFHSNIYHSVKPYFGQNDRIAIAWDAIYTF